ncbi:MAG: ABC transporter ATP-binding protein [Pseudomonadota bacterium]
MSLVATDLARSFAYGRKGLFRRQATFFAVDGVSLTIEAGKTHGIVGESGCGKSTLAKLLLGLIALDRGMVALNGEQISDVSEARWRALRQRVQLVYQDAAGALDPRLPVRAQVEEPLAIHGLPLADAEEALEAVGLSGRLADRYPHEMSGGQLQRVVIARALALKPDVLVLDEPVSALDVSIQAQIVNLLLDLQRDRGLTYLFVSHDLSVVHHISDRISVMYLGQIVEEASRDALFSNPLHPYTKALMAAVPDPDPRKPRTAAPKVGDPPNPAFPPSGCRYHPRCPMAEDRCRTTPPELRDMGGRRVACHLAEVA